MAGTGTGKGMPPAPGAPKPIGSPGSTKIGGTKIITAPGLPPGGTSAPKMKMAPTQAPTSAPKAPKPTTKTSASQPRLSLDGAMNRPNLPMRPLGQQGQPPFQSKGSTGSSGKSVGSNAPVPGMKAIGPANKPKSTQKLTLNSSAALSNPGAGPKNLLPKAIGSSSEKKKLEKVRQSATGGGQGTGPTFGPGAGNNPGSSVGAGNAGNGSGPPMFGNSGAGAAASMEAPGSSKSNTTTSTPKSSEKRKLKTKDKDKDKPSKPSKKRKQSSEGGKKSPKDGTKESSSKANEGPKVGDSLHGGKKEGKETKEMKITSEISSPHSAGPEGASGGGELVASMGDNRKLKKDKIKKKKDKLLAKSDKGGSATPVGHNPSRRLPTASSRGDREVKKKKDKSGSSTAAAAPIIKNDKDSPTPAPRDSYDATSPDGSNASIGEPASGGGSGTTGSAPPGYSAQQAAVNDMMRRALEEDQYSALGSVVDTESSDDEDGNVNSAMYLVRMSGGQQGGGWGRPKRHGGGAIGSEVKGTWYGNTKMDRNSLLAAMRKHIRMEGMKTVGNFDGNAFLEDAEEYHERVHGEGVSFRKQPRSLSPRPEDEIEEEQRSNGNVGRGGRKKKKKKGKRGRHDGHGQETGVYGSGEDDFHGDGVDSSGMDSSGGDDDVIEHHNGDEDESSIFGQTAGATNATWVECDRCKKWRRLRGVVDARKLPSRWYCSMNKNDPERAKCSAPEEEYDTATTPESAMDQRTRKHLRVWVRRLHCNETYENRHLNGARSVGNSKKRNAIYSKEPYEWIRCCNPSCGKWRMLLRSMDASTIIDQCKNGEWYCVMNTWDEKAASCGAAQENLPSIGCPPWVMTDEE